jgi:electron transfer flavoprotein alpha subunit
MNAGVVHPQVPGAQASGPGSAAESLARLSAVAVIVVRDAQLPAGADEAAAEAGGYAVLAGSGTRDAAASLTAVSQVWVAERSSVAPAALSAALAPALSPVPLLILPASPDGRDLAPRLALALDRPLLAGAVRCTRDVVELTRLDDRLSVQVAADGPAVVTLRPGVAGSLAPAALETVVELQLPAPGGHALPGDEAQPSVPAGPDAQTETVLPPEPATVDLAEAKRIVAGGAGLVAAEANGTAVMRLLADVAAALGASAGATRVVTDAGWMGYDRQIGTTGVAVSPELYIAFGISGAAQHIGGLGSPEHVVSVNTDPSCPMTAMADLGIVADAQEALAELAKRLGIPGTDRATSLTGQEGDGHV